MCDDGDGFSVSIKTASRLCGFHADDDGGQGRSKGDASRDWRLEGWQTDVCLAKA